MKKNYLQKTLEKVFLLLVLFYSINLLFSQNKDEEYKIGITTGAFVPEKSTVSSKRISAAKEYKGKRFYIFQFYQTPTEEQKAKWASQGLVLLDYLPGKAFFVSLEKRFDVTQISSLVRASFEPDFRFKLEKKLYDSGAKDAKLFSGKVKLILSYYKGLDEIEIKNELANLGITITDSRKESQQLHILVNPSLIGDIASKPYVQFLELFPEEPFLEDKDHRNTTGRANYLNSDYNGLNFNGSGITVAIGEDGALQDEVDTKGRVVAEQETGYSSHKVGVMENSVGAGNLDPSNRNNSWGANLVSATGSPNYSTMFTTNNVLYTNHSYGSTIAGSYYNSGARSHDLLLETIPNYCVIYSAGNSGTEIGNAPYDIVNWGNITGSYKMNKNMLSIGSVKPNDDLGGFSSRGPMYDGRIAPQMVVEGNEGTSFAAPKAMGIMTQLNQVYQTKNGVVPSSTLLRAVMLNSADDIENVGPDFKTGFGKINARKAYNIINQNQIISGNVFHAATNSHTINIPAGTKQLRVMIVWSDKAAIVNANPAIVNDLDLTAENPSTTIFEPWILDSSLPTSDAKLNTPANKGKDHLNTIEQITVDNPDTGNWTLKVNGYNVPYGPQNYYITYEFLQDEVKFMAPLKNQKLTTQSNYYLRWDSYGNSGTFDLDYQIDNGSWVNIVTNYDATKRVYDFTAPLVSGIHTIKFRVKRGSLISESDVNYIGGVDENFRIQKVCGNDVTLKWSGVNGATSYKIYKVGANYMEEMTSDVIFNGNSATLTNQSATQNEYYALSALTGTIEGGRTFAVLKNPGDYNCTAVNWIGAISTDWFTPGNWSSGIVPTSADAIVIPSAPTNQPRIAAAGATCNNITIDNGASLTMDAVTSYTLSVYGDWINNGTFTSGKGIVDFSNTSASQEISGTSTTTFDVLKITKGDPVFLLDAKSPITTTTYFNLTSGTFKLNNPNSSVKLSTVLTDRTIDSNKKIWLADGTITGTSSMYLWGGDFRISGGLFSLISSSTNLYYNYDSKLIIDGGEIRTYRIRPYDANASFKYYQYGGMLTLGTSTTVSSIPNFDLNALSIFEMSGGQIVLQTPSSATSDYQNLASSYTVTGGKLLIGNASSAVNKIFRINTTVPIYQLEIANNGKNSSAQIVNQAITVKNNISILGGVLDANNFNINIEGNWLNNGSFTPGTGTVLFNGNLPQSIAGTSASVFNNLTLNNSQGLALTGTTNTQINGILQLNNGVVTTNNNTLVISSTGNVNRVNGHIFGNLKKYFSASQLSNNFEVGDALISNYAPANITFSSITSPGNVTVTTKQGDHLSINSSTLLENKSVNRNWKITNEGLVFSSYQGVFNYLNSDLDATTNYNSIKGGLYANSAWSYPTVGSLTANSAQLLALTSFGDVQLASDSTLGVENAQTQKLIYYPNPVKDSLNITNENTITRVEIYDAKGVLVKVLHPYQKQFSIDLKKYSAGVYMVNLQTNSRNIQFKIIKE